MAYQKKQWKNRISTNPLRRLLTPTDGSSAYTVDVSRAEGTVTEEGDAFNADTMNDLEDRIEAGIGAGSNIVAAPEATSVASRAYSVNEFLVYDNKFYKVISAIAAGASLVPGVNLQERTVGQELSSSIGTDNGVYDQLHYGNTPFYLDYQGGKWGWNSSPARGAGTFHPFKTIHSQSYNLGARGVTDLGELHEYRYINAERVYSQGYTQGKADARVTGISVGGMSWAYNTNGISVTNGAFYFIRCHTWLVETNQLSLAGCEIYGGDWYMTDGDGNGDHVWLVKATSNVISSNREVMSWSYKMLGFYIG